MHDSTFPFCSDIVRRCPRLFHVPKMYPISQRLRRPQKVWRIPSLPNMAATHARPWSSLSQSCAICRKRSGSFRPPHRRALRVARPAASSPSERDLPMPHLAFGPEDRDHYTLRQVAELRLGLAFDCRNCGKFTSLDVLTLIERYGAATELGNLRPKARCSRCGKQAADVLTRVPGVRGERAWWPRPPGATR
jgi:hypothetical protein